VAGDGSGTIRSSSPAIDCKAQCTQNVATGAAVQLVALADASSTFRGWSGACSGTAECTLTMDADRDVTATFAAAPPPPPGMVRLSVQPVGMGTGRVTSSPVGIDCPGTCEMTVAVGTRVSFSAVPAASSKFVGWGGACSGAGGCSVTANADQTVWVNFETTTPPANSCAGIAAPDNVAMQRFVQDAGRTFFSCGSAAGDASGAMGMTLHTNDPSSHSDQILFMTTAGVRRQDRTTNQGVLPLQQPSGLSALAGAPYLGPLANQGSQLVNFDSSGAAKGETFLFGKGLASVADPSGGVLIAGDFALAKSDPASGFVPAGPAQHAVAMFTGGGTAPAVAWGPVALASKGAVFGAGIDLVGRALVITDGAPKFGAGNVSGQWFDRDGTALTGEFVLVTGFTAGASTWFETSPRIGSGLIVRRMDAGPHAHMLVTVDSGSTSVQPAPAWMAGRTDTRLQIARGGRAYAALPFGAAGVACSQRVDVVAPDGTVCGGADYPIGAGNCDTKDLMLGADGTVIQQLPDAMETKSDLSTHSCTWRWWAGVLK